MLTFTALAQYKLSGTVIGKANQPAAYATVAIVQANDSSIVKGGLTDESGHFMVTNIAPGTYRARISSVGYNLGVCCPKFRDSYGEDSGITG